MGISFNAASLLNGNGINVTSVVDALLSAGNAPLNSLAKRADGPLHPGRVAGRVITTTSRNLQAAVSRLANTTGPLASQSATSSDSSILTASAAQPRPLAGTHQIVVSNLATTGTLYTNPLANGDLILDQPRHHRRHQAANGRVGRHHP